MIEIPTILIYQCPTMIQIQKNLQRASKGEVEAKKNNGPALIGEGEDDDAETDDDGFEFI